MTTSNRLAPLDGREATSAAAAPSEPLPSSVDASGILARIDSALIDQIAANMWGALGGGKAPGAPIPSASAPGATLSALAVPEAIPAAVIPGAAVPISRPGAPIPSASPGAT